MRWLAFMIAVAACGSSSDAPAPAPAPRSAVGSGEQPHHRNDRHDSVTAPANLRVDVVIGSEKSTWQERAFTKTPKLVGSANDGEARDTWSLRALVHQNVGPSARVLAVVSAEGTKAIDRAAWDDLTKTPILHTTKRGTLKYRWTDEDGKWGETELKDVTLLEVTR